MPISFPPQEQPLPQAPFSTFALSPNDKIYTRTVSSVSMPFDHRRHCHRSNLPHQEHFLQPHEPISVDSPSFLPVSPKSLCHVKFSSTCNKIGHIPLDPVSRLLLPRNVTLIRIS